MCVSLQGNLYLPYVISGGVYSSGKAHGAVAVKELLEEGTAGEPHPAAGVHTPVSVQQQLLKHLTNRQTHGI